MSETKKLPDATTHRVVASIGLPCDLRACAVQLQALDREYPGAVIITDGPLWRSDAYVVAVPLETKP